MNKIRRYVLRQLPRTEYQLSNVEHYNPKEHTFHGGWTKGYLEGKMSVLEDIMDFIEDEDEIFHKKMKEKIENIVIK